MLHEPQDNLALQDYVSLSNIHYESIGVEYLNSFLMVPDLDAKF